MTPHHAFEDASKAHQRGDFRAAEEGYRKVLQSEPRNARVWFVLGSLCSDLGRQAEAVAFFRQTVEIAPHDGQAHLHLANTLLKLEKHEEAERAFRRCLEVVPGQVEALVNLGFVLGEMHRLPESKQFFEHARLVAPDRPEIHHNLGNTLRELGESEAALRCFDEALRLRPDYAKAHINRGVVLLKLARVQEAITSVQRGIEIQPEFAEAHNSLASAYSAAGRFEEAIAEFRRAIELKPNNPDAQWNLALIWLLQGDYERGWPGYEWRWRCPSIIQLPKQSRPRWDGSSPAGKTILLVAEQGLGDTLHFVRYAPLIQALGARVVLQCQPGLLNLLSRTPGIDALIPAGAPSPNCDCWLPLMSAPTVMKTTLASVPGQVPYLFADGALVEKWRSTLAGIPGFRIGIAWQGSPKHSWDRHRSLPLSAFERLARIPGVQLVSLQKESGEGEDCNFPLARFGGILDRAGAFTDTAAIMMNLDLVVSINTAVAHLAGGLGVRTWMPIHHTPDWRWLLERRDSPWYPTIRLFRQRVVGEWGPVIQEIATELGQLVAHHAETRPLLVEVSAGEFLDKIVILRIKSERITDPEKLVNVKREQEVLGAIRATMALSQEVLELEVELKKANEHLWEIEDEIREHEKREDFGSRFVELARWVYQTNDRRAELKRQINRLLKSRLVEEKSYQG